jgi:hypothetical protein
VLEGIFAIISVFIRFLPPTFLHEELGETRGPYSEALGLDRNILSSNCGKENEIWCFSLK